MSTSTAKITGAEVDSMVDRGEFDGFGPRKIELILTPKSLSPIFQPTATLLTAELFEVI